MASRMEAKAKEATDLVTEKKRVCDLYIVWIVLSMQNYISKDVFVCMRR